MGTRDIHIDWMRKRRYINIYEMQGIFDNATSGVPEGSLTVGVTQVKIGTSGVVAYDMNAGEFIGGMIPVPIDLDSQYDIGFRVHYSGTVSLTTGTNTWLLLYDFKAVDVAIAPAATALDTVIGADAYGANTDDLNKVSPRGIIDAASYNLTRAQIEAGAKLILKLELDVHTNMDSAVFLILEMDYVPMRTQGIGNEVPRPLQADGVN